MNKFQIIQEEKNMSRQITISIEDEDTKKRIFAKISFDEVNSLFENHKINCLNHIAETLNEQLNIELGEDVKLSIDTNLNP